MSGSHIHMGEYKAQGPTEGRALRVTSFAFALVDTQAS